MTTLPSLIRQLRESRSMTRPQLARSSNISRAHLWAIETGRLTPGLSTLEKLSEALGVGLGRFLTESNAEMLLEDPFIRGLRPLLPRLNVQHRQLILQTLQAAPQKRKSQ